MAKQNLFFSKEAAIEAGLACKEVPNGVSAVRFCRIKAEQTPKGGASGSVKGGGWFVGYVWDGSYHDAHYWGPFVIAYTFGRKKRLKRVNRLFQQAKTLLVEQGGEDPCVKRFDARRQVREGD
jgi:hypothetical protein